MKVYSYQAVFIYGAAVIGKEKGNVQDIFGCLWNESQPAEILELLWGKELGDRWCSALSGAANFPAVFRSD